MNTEKSRKKVYGFNLIVLVIATLAIVGIVNWLGAKHYKRWDIAHPASTTLSDQTIKILKSLDKDVKVTFFYTFSSSDEEQGSDAFKELLERYKSISKRFDYEMIDYVKNPGRVSEFVNNNKDISLENNSSVVKSGEFMEKITATTEEALTGAIIKVTRGQVRTVCFTTGHGEHDADEAGTSGYSKAKTSLVQENFETKNINVLEKGIPDACNVLIIAGPVLQFKSEEAALVEKWVANGGKAMIMLDATGKTGLESMLDKYNIVVYNDVLKTEESAAAGTDPLWIYADNYNQEHPVTKALSQLGMLVGDRLRTIPSYFFEARSLNIKEQGDQEVTTEPLITSSDNVRVLSSSESTTASKYAAFRTQSGAETGTDETFGAPIGEVGAQIIAVYAQKQIEKAQETPAATPEAEPAKSGKSARIIVFGDSDFAADGNIGELPSGDIFMNSVSWLAEDESSIGIRPREKKFIPLHFAGTNKWLILLGILFLVPLVVFLNGWLVYKEKKNL